MKRGAILRILALRLQGLGYGSFRKLGVPYFRVLIMILLFRVLY